MSVHRSMHYRSDLAHIHDAGFVKLATATIPWLVERLRALKWKGGRIVELGCGTGVLAAGMIAEGYDVTGYDISADMLKHARQRAPKGDFRQASFLDAKIPPCVAIVAQGEVFNYLFDRRNAPSKLPRLFRRLADALPQGGLLLFDIAEPGRAGRQGHVRGYSEGNDWACLFSAVEDRQTGILTRTITSFRQVGEFYTRDHEVHRLRLLDRTKVLRQLRVCGFSARPLRQLGDWKFPRGWTGVLAHKIG